MWLSKNSNLSFQRIVFIQPRKIFTEGHYRWFSRGSQDPLGCPLYYPREKLKPILPCKLRMLRRGSWIDTYFGEDLKKTHKWENCILLGFGRAIITLVRIGYNKTLFRSNWLILARSSVDSTHDSIGFPGNWIHSTHDSSDFPVNWFDETHDWSENIRFWVISRFNHK